MLIFAGCKVFLDQSLYVVVIVRPNKNEGRGIVEALGFLIRYAEGDCLIVKTVIFTYFYGFFAKNVFTFDSDKIIVFSVK